MCRARPALFGRRSRAAATRARSILAWPAIFPCCAERPSHAALASQAQIHLRASGPAPRAFDGKEDLGFRCADFCLLFRAQAYDAPCLVRIAERREDLPKNSKVRVPHM